MKKYVVVSLLMVVLTACHKNSGNELVIISSTGLDIEYPVSSLACAYNINRWIEEQLKVHFQDEDSLTSIQDYNEYFALKNEENIRQYRGDLERVVVDTAYYTDSLIVKKIYENEQYITYSVYEHQSYGNTHPWLVTSYQSFNKQTGALVRFADLFAKEQTKEIIQRVWAEIDRQTDKSVPKEFRRAKDTDFTFHNPAVTADGVLFFFHPGEVGPAVEGEYKVVIPLTDKNIK